MSQHDVYRPGGTDALVVDCQSDMLAYLPTRFVVALLPTNEAPLPAARFNPIISFEKRDYQLAPQYAASLSVAELGERIGSLADEHFRILTAIDFLVGGY